MFETSPIQTFEKLTRSSQGKPEFQELLTAGGQLLETAYYQHKLAESSQNSPLRRFVDTPYMTQILWEKETSQCARDQLAINLGQGALRFAINYSDGQLSHSLTIGEQYARVSDRNPIRAFHTDHLLRDDRDENYDYNPIYAAEHLSRFKAYLDKSVALMGLTYAIDGRKETYREAA